MEERKAVEAGDGLVPSAPTTQGQVGGEGSWGLPEPQPGLTPARCWEGGELWKEDGWTDSS